MAPIKQKSAALRTPKKEASAAESKLPTIHVGEVLRQAREERGVSLDAVADELMIRRFYLDALEAGSFKDLPERVYASGFVRNYATYLGLQPSSVVEQFKREAYGARNMSNYQVELNMPEPVVQSVVPNRSAIISAVVVLIVLVIGIVFMTQDKEPAVSAIPEPTATETAAAPAVEAPATGSVAAPAPTTAEGDVPADDVPAMEFTTPANGAAAVTTTTTQEAPVAAAATETAPAAVAAAATEEATPADTATPGDVPPAALRVKNRRVLEALQSAWVEVKNDKGVILFTSILKAGQILPLPDNVKIVVTTGNAGGLRMIADGKAQAPFGQANEVKRNIMLDPQDLPQR